MLTSAVSSAGTTKIKGTLNAAASTTLTIQFFANATADPSGSWPGADLLGIDRGHYQFFRQRDVHGELSQCRADRPIHQLDRDRSRRQYFGVCPGCDGRGGAPARRSRCSRCLTTRPWERLLASPQVASLAADSTDDSSVPDQLSDAFLTELALDIIQTGPGKLEDESLRSGWGLGYPGGRQARGVHQGLEQVLEGGSSLAGRSSSA